MKTEAVQFDELTEDYKKMLMNFIKNIDFGDRSLSLSYGKELENRINNFYKTLMNRFNINKLMETGNDLNLLCLDLEKFNKTINNKGFLKRFGYYNPKNHLNNIIINYSKLEKNIKASSNDLNIKIVDFLKEVSTLDNIHKYCEQYLKKLSLYIIAGDEKTELYKNDRNKTINGTEKYDKHEIANTDKIVKEFIYRLGELKDKRTILNEIISYIIMFKNNNINLIERINSSLINYYDKWNEHMLKAFVDSKKNNYNIDNIKNYSDNFTIGISQLLVIQKKSINMINEIEVRVK